MTSAPSDPSVNSPAGSAHTAVVELTVTGMHCDSCVALIEEMLAEQAGVASAVVDLDSASARVEFDTSLVTVDALCATVVKAGYSASLREGSSAGS
ncbi:MAG: heavy-metal-associated domain-containing protein [Acidimicrobiia bacterium]